MVQATIDFSAPLHGTLGPAFEARLDRPRINLQMESIRDFMLDGTWRTLGEITTALRYPEASVSAQLRHLRKPRFGGYHVEKRRRGIETHGLWEYRVTRSAE